MKIMINYDLVDKAQTARTGFSLNKFKKGVGVCTGAVSGLTSLTVVNGSQSLEDYLVHCLYAFTFYCFYYGVPELASKKFNIELANQQLDELVPKLRDIFIDTDVEMLRDVKCYETEYELSTRESFIPRIMQKKYINVPVDNDWGNNVRSIVQEHILGTKEYALSHGEPEKKVLTLGQKRYAKK